MIYYEIIILFRSNSIFPTIPGILGSACAIVAFGALDYVKDTTLFIVLCFLVRICEALGSCAFSTVSYIYIMNEFSNVVGWAFGLLETFVGLGMSLGPGNLCLHLLIC